MYRRRPRNTQAPFRLQDFKMWKRYTVLLLLALPPSVNSKETPTPRMCAVCPEPRCALVSEIWPKGNDTSILWKKQDEEIPQCFNDNLKSDKPCQMPNGNLVLRTMDELEFEWKNLTSRDAGLMSSVNKPCADLNLPPSSTPSPGMCAVCLEKYCATGVRRIFPAGGKTAVWEKAKSPTGIQNCSMENLKPDAPCKMADGSLVQLANEMLHFDGIDTYGVRRPFKSQISPCAELNLPSSYTPSPVTKTPIHNTLTPAATNNSVAGKKGIIGSVISIIFIISIISIGVLIWKRNSCGQGQDGDHRHGNNGVPPHDAEDRDEITVQMQPPNVSSGRSPRGNVNGEDDSVGTAGLLG